MNRERDYFIVYDDQSLLDVIPVQRRGWYDEFFAFQMDQSMKAYEAQVKTMVFLCVLCNDAFVVPAICKHTRLNMWKTPLSFRMFSRIPLNFPKEPKNSQVFQSDSYTHVQ